MEIAQCCEETRHTRYVVVDRNNYINLFYVYARLINRVKHPLINQCASKAFLTGQNSFAVADASNTGLNSGLDTRASDYVARASYQPNSIYKFTSRFRFAEDGFIMKRMELETSVNFDRWNALLLYGDYAAQPEIGFLNRRQGLLGSGQYKLDTNWVVLGSALYDLNANKFSQTRLGFGYIDDCLILALNYITNYTYSGNVTADHQIMLQLTLRTLGGTSVGQTVSSQTQR